ncbi:hypothetical protein FCH28_11290 [Streptomyces piniterrae]|uniref:Uncharacterized protein n=1 Tax=Streptomyces piniterrae TaxID=2571125 RepID=A0A4U0NNA3_9ACTN|nr:hypothetical protein [Streptomyces piniterrae]TJZ55865.1 hypothetical protein FCH28_11290 [Streptomyces piniterrae]
MDPIAPAAVRASGSIAGAALGRNRSVGIARIGSAEDRAQAYHRFMEAAQRCTFVMLEYFLRRKEATGPSPLRQPLWRLFRHWCAEGARTRMMQAQVELHAALMGIELCAPAPVREAAQKVIGALHRFEDRPDDYIGVLTEHTEAQVEFLHAARHDLAYNPKFWQLLRKLRERRYRKRAEQRVAQIIDGSVPASDAMREAFRRRDRERREASPPSHQG